MNLRPYARLRTAALLLVCSLFTAGCARDNADPLAQPDGEWLFINYWAEWCKPCIEEIPELNAFHREQAGKARVVMVNFDGVSGAALQEQAASLGIETTLFEGDAATRFGFEKPEVLPSTHVIGPDGTLRQTLLGPQTTATLAAAMSGR
jgi:thiol-disulfide isomerase/thioredoxin